MVIAGSLLQRLIMQRSKLSNRKKYKVHNLRRIGAPESGMELSTVLK